MAIEPEEIPEAEDEGGPVKSFLDHLEDLRWVLIKSCAVIAVAVVVCLVAGDKLVQIIKWPLTRAKVQYAKQNQVVTLLFGTNRLGTFELDEARQQRFSLGTNQFIALQIEPVNVGTNTLLGVRMETNQALAQTARQLHVDLINLSPAEGFMVAFQVAIYGGVVVSSPFVFYFIAQFIFPALKRNEKKYIFRGLFFGFGLFLLGISFCYFVLMPIALTASQMYSHWLGFTAFQWKAGEYISFVCKFMLGMGLGFEMPVIILILVKLGIVTYRTLKTFRPYMIVINLILGAVLTTPEVITQVLMFIPLQLLYEISIVIAWYWQRQEARRTAAAEMNSGELTGGS